MYLACWVSNSAWALALASEPALLLRLLLHLVLEAAEKVQETVKEDCNYTGHNVGEMQRLRPCRGQCHILGGSRGGSEEDQFSSKQIIQFVIERSRNRNSAGDSISLTQAFQCHIFRKRKQFALYGTKVRERTLKRHQSRAGHLLKTAGVIFSFTLKKNNVFELKNLAPNGLVKSDTRSRAFGPRCECTPRGCASALSCYPPSRSHERSCSVLLGPHEAWNQATEFGRPQSPTSAPNTSNFATRPTPMDEGRASTR